MPVKIVVTDERGPHEIDLLTEADVKVAVERYQQVLSEDEESKRLFKIVNPQVVRDQIEKMLGKKIA